MPGLALTMCTKDVVTLAKPVYRDGVDFEACARAFAGLFDLLRPFECLRCVCLAFRLECEVQ